MNNDLIIAEIILSNSPLLKQADGNLVSSISDKIKNYVGNNIDENDKLGSLVNIITPGAIATALGFRWFGLLIGLAMRIFHIDIAAIFSSIFKGLKSELSSKSKVDEASLGKIVDNAFQENVTSQISDEELESKATIQDARMIKLALISYSRNVKTAAFSRQSKVTSILKSITSIIFKVALASAGLMLAGDIINKAVGLPNAIDNTVQKGKPVESTKPKITSTQTKFKVKSSYSKENYNNNSDWIEKIKNNSYNIERMLISFAHDVYDNLQDFKIQSSPLFKDLVHEISIFNAHSPNAPLVFIPKNYHSKKDLADTFIDEVANKTI